MSPLSPHKFLQHMELPLLRGAFILGCLEQRVTLYSQQVRALNLAYSLSKERRLTRGTKVLVIGGGAAGLTFAAGAAHLGGEVTLLERRGEALATFLGNNTRWLHPHIYEWPRPDSDRKNAGLPLLNWSADKAGGVARELLTQWRELQEQFPIHVFYHAKSINNVSRAKDALEFTWNARRFDSGSFAIVVFAVGFGDEQQVPGAGTPPYWKDDDLHQPMSPLGSRCLVSGIGDGGVVDLLRLRLTDFQHDQVVRELLSGEELKPVKDELLAIEEDVSQQALSSGELFRRYRNLKVPDGLHQCLSERLRSDVRVVLNSPEPYPLSAKASILNRFLLSRLLEVDDLEYRQDIIKQVEPPKDGVQMVDFESGKQDSFNRVIVRHGARPALERDFPSIWKEAISHLSSISNLDQTRDPIWDDHAFSQKRGSATARTPKAGTSQLPKADPVIGRVQEVNRIVAAILAPSPSPVVVLGPPGVGKSTVALEALGHADAERRYGHRRYFARLDGVDTGEAISATIAQEIGVTSVSDLSARVLTELDKAPTLLVLDNADTPWEKDRPGTEDLLRTLASKPDLAVITTLRGKELPDFGVSPDPVVPVPPLTQQESLELFCSIAYNVPRDHPGLSELLRDMGGVALAVKLLARQAQGVELEITLQRWTEERTAMLQFGSGPDPSLAVSIEFSLKNSRLSEEPEALKFFSMLALLPAGMAMHDRNAVAPTSAKAIARLQKAALIQLEGKRWRLLAVIREHVRRTRPARDEDKKRIVGFYLSLACSLGPQIGKAHGHEALKRLSEEVDNIESLILMSLEEADSDAAMDAVLHLSDFVRFSGHGSARPLKKAIEVAKKQGNTVKEAQCLLALGRLYLLRRPQYALAQKYVQEALHLFEEGGDGRAQADCLRELGHTAINAYELEQEGVEKLSQAEDYFQRALAMQHQFRDSVGEAYCLHGLARVLDFQGKREEARQFFSTTLQMFREQKDLLGQAYSLRHLGALQEDDSLLEEAGRGFAEVGELHNQAHCLRIRSDLASKDGQFEEAEQLCRHALELFLELQAIREAAWCRISLARVVHARSTSSKEARELLQQACTSALKLGDKRCEAECRQLLREWGPTSE